VGRLDFRVNDDIVRMGFVEPSVPITSIRHPIQVNVRQGPRRSGAADQQPLA
jgi:hypothetical protein